MRSVFVHLKGATEGEVTSWLNSFTQARGSDNTWVYPDAAQPILYIDFYRDYAIEFEPKDYERLITALGGVPSLSVAADVSGRTHGTTEVKNFVIVALQQFEGIGQDDYSTHFWTLQEIEDDAVVDGLHFFDAEGAQ